MHVLRGRIMFGIGNDKILGNFLGIIAVLMWGFLPLLRLMAGEIPPLQLTCMSLFLASLVTFLLNGYLKLSSRDRKMPRAHGDIFWSTIFLLGAVIFYFAALAVACGAWMSGMNIKGTWSNP